MADKKIRIMHIAECAGGVDVYLSMLLPLLEKKGLYQYFVCSKLFDKAKYEKMVDGVEQIDMKQSFSPFSIIKNVRKVKKIIKSIKPDIIYCHSSFAGGIGRLAAKGSKIKIVYNPHGWAFNMNQKSSLSMSIKSKLYLVIEKFLARKTDRIVCISKAERQSALEKKIAKDQKLSLITNGIDISKVRSANRFKRSDFNIPEKAFVVGMIGRLCPQKAPDTFIHSAKLIKEKIPDSFFIIVGDGELTDQTVEYARQNNIDLLVTGWVDNPYDYLQLFDISLLLSRWEGFGLAIVEYMAAEKNVVASRIDAIPTIIEDGVDGFLVEVDNPNDVCDKVMYIHNHPAEAANMRKNALEKVIRDYDVNRVADQHVELFQELMNS